MRAIEIIGAIKTIKTIEVIEVIKAIKTIRTIKVIKAIKKLALLIGIEIIIKKKLLSKLIYKSSHLRLEKKIIFFLYKI